MNPNDPIIQIGCALFGREAYTARRDAILAQREAPADAAKAAYHRQREDDWLHAGGKEDDWPDLASYVSARGYDLEVRQKKTSMLYLAWRALRVPPFSQDDDAELILEMLADPTVSPRLTP